MKTSSRSVVLMLFLSGWMAQGQGILTGHTDITFKYDASEMQWQAMFRHAGTFDNPDTETPFSEASLPEEDQVHTGRGRLTTPSSGFEFTGALPGDPLWVLPQTDRGYTWPGLRTEAPLNTFEGDVKITLQSVTYAGYSPDPAHFSVWQFQDGAIVQMATADGIDGSDFASLQENDHSHHNFGFTALGIYRVGLQASGIFNGTGETATSETEYVTFAIGTLATWLAEHYAGVDLVDDQVTGSDADSDGDHVKLIEEYAFNLVPTLKDKHYLERDTGVSGLPIGWVGESGGQDRLHLQMVCRKADTNPQIQYFVEFNDDFSDDEGWEVVTPSTLQSIDGTWERVTVVDTESVSTRAQRFARVRIVVQESINY